jgi:hypothetical protein
MSRTYRKRESGNTRDGDSITPTKLKRTQRKQRRAKEKRALQHSDELPIFVKYNRSDFD